MATLFDRYLVVDWSSAGRPVTGKDSVWIADLDATGEGRDVGLDNPPTRHAAERILAERLAVAARTGRRTLVAVDAPLGYPAGAAAYFGASGVPAWRGMWRLVADRLSDDARNANDRFEVAAELNRRGRAVGPYWGCPVGRSFDGLAPTKPRPFPISEFRHCEGWLRTAGLRPASCWQLTGVGSVGSQTLTLLPILERFVGSGVAVWPFTTGWRAPAVAAGSAVVAETWPTAFDVTYPIHWIRDAAQVHDVAVRLRDADEAGELAGWFESPFGSTDATQANRDVTADVETEEGWVLIPPPASRDARAR